MHERYALNALVVDATARTSAREAVPEGRTLGEEVGTRLLRRLELLTIKRWRRAAVAVATVRGVAAAGLGLRCAAELERPGRRRTRRRLAVAAGCTGTPVAAAEAVGRQVDAVLLQAVDVGLHLGRQSRCATGGRRARARAVTGRGSSGRATAASAPGKGDKRQQGQWDKKARSLCSLTRALSQLALGIT